MEIEMNTIRTTNWTWKNKGGRIEMRKQLLPINRFARLFLGLFLTSMVVNIIVALFFGLYQFELLMGVTILVALALVKWALNPYHKITLEPKRLILHGLFDKQVFKGTIEWAREEQKISGKLPYRKVRLFATINGVTEVPIMEISNYGSDKNIFDELLRDLNKNIGNCDKIPTTH